MKILEGYKTYITAIAAIMVAVGVAIQDYYAGNTVNTQIVIEALIALAMIFLRHGTKTDTSPPEA
jgi:hypothetical protein